ncbi:sulfite exporter TauE/SafE family protein [Vreelandella utahensis]|uniref:sulfite exporter TauE/SafE family protein n=1 Tax=Vreelandella halophila TaxID=86177 RepID=UPI0009878217|nr:sulfite exporter TauE/SafE family protein [Halomonas utahensis]
MAELGLYQILLANLVVLAGACLQGVVGYGIGTLSAPLLFLISPMLVPGPLTLNSTLLTLMMLARNRMAVRVREVRLAIGGGMVGTCLAAATLMVISPWGFELIFGVLILVAVGLSMAGWRPRLTGRSSVLAGMASTFMGTITAVGGPPIAMIYQNERGPLVRANMSAFFLFASLLSLSALAFSGYLGAREWLLFLVTVPGVIAGFLLSARFVGRVDGERLRGLILGIAALAGAAALVQGLLSL